jgi:sugar phosphate isomerase/epimerase
MKSTSGNAWILSWIAGLAAVFAPAFSPTEAWSQERDDSAAESLGWRVAVQAYSFKKFTFFEAVDKAEALGLRYIEAYSKQPISADMPEVTTHFTMSEETRQAIREKLKLAGITLTNYGVVKGKNEEEWRQIFGFARDMGIETIASEPADDAMDLVEQLSEEFGVNVAIHNHAKPSHYWDPKIVLAACEGRSKRLGACADTGHWMRSGLDPLEALKLLEGRLVSFHLKDLNESGAPKAHDVPWGTGKGDVKALLAEARRQGFRGVFSIEYEHNWDDSQGEIAECIKYFDQIAAELAAE